MNVLNFLKNFILLTLILSLPRLTQILIHYNQFQSFNDVYFNAFTGLRFDLLVISFSLIPIFLFFVVNLKHQSKYVGFLNFFSAIIWLIFGCVYFFNFISLDLKQDLIWSQNWIQIPEILMASSWVHLLSSLILAIFLFYCGFYFFKEIRRILMMATFPSKIGIFLILAFFARGSLGKDHLRRNDCDGRRSSVVRAICLNPVYVALKIKNLEFGP